MEVLVPDVSRVTDCAEVIFTTKNSIIKQVNILRSNVLLNMINYLLKRFLITFEKISKITTIQPTPATDLRI